MYSLISAGGYTGTYYSALYDPRLVSIFKGATSLVSFQPPEEPTPAIEAMETDVNAVDSDAALTSGVVGGYLFGRLLHQGTEEGGFEPDARIGPEGGVHDDVRDQGAGRSHEVPGLPRHPDRRRAGPSC